MQPWDLINPVDATTFARLVPDDYPDTLLQWLPQREVQDVRARTARVQRTNSTAAFRSWNAESPIGERGVTKTITEVRFPPISEKLPLDEIDRIELFLAARSGTSDPAFEQILEAAYDDIATISRRIRNRMELARGDVLTDGKFTITENGLSGLEADFGLVSGQKPTAGTLWSNPAAPAIDHELAWMLYLQNLSGKPVTRALTSLTVVQYLQANEQYRQYRWPTGDISTLPNLTQAEVNQIRASLGLPPITIYDHQLSVNGSTTRVIPVNKFLLGVADLGETQWGITPDALDLVKSGAVVTRDAPGLVAGTWQTTDPTTKWTKVSGCGMPIIGDNTGLLTATVA